MNLPKQLLLFIWTLTFSASILPAEIIDVSVGTQETNNYGYGFRGVLGDQYSVQFRFSTLISSGDLEMSVVGFDIDDSDEVSVQINGTSLGFLAQTANKKKGSSKFLIPASSLVNAGTNLLTFTQKTPGWMWGIKNLLLEYISPPIPNNSLEIGVLDDARYGARYSGVLTDQDTVFFDFPYTLSAGNLTLSVTGYDIDDQDEVTIRLNGSNAGFLTQTSNKETASSILSLPSNLLNEGTNTLSFSQKNSGWMWGIKNVLIYSIPAIPNNLLIMGVTETTHYGSRYQGIALNQDSVLFDFSSSSSSIDLGLYITGYDIDDPDEVSVQINDSPIGFLEPTDNKKNGLSEFLIPANLLVEGTNTLTVSQKNPGWMWGIKDIVIDYLSTPLPGNNSAFLGLYDLVFSDEFADTHLDSAKWDTALLWGPYLPTNNEQQLYVDSLGMHEDFLHSPFNLTGGTLKIAATPTSVTLSPPARPPSDSPLWQPNTYSEYVQNYPTGSVGDSDYSPGYQASEVDYLSGIITSYGSFKMSHGYVEMRAKLPKGAGLWPAFWLLPQHYVKDVPEIDVMEFLGHDIENLYHTYHYFDIEDDWNLISTHSYATSATDWTADFHTFGMAWSPTEIAWYVDGEETKRITETEFVIPNQPMHLIANLAVGGNWPGSPDENTVFPAVFEIDYIRAYKKNLRQDLDLANDYQLMFDDDFLGDTLDKTKWNTHFLWGPYLPINFEEQYYVDSLGSDEGGLSPFTLNQGILSISARMKDDPLGFSIPEILPTQDAAIWNDYETFNRNLSYSAPSYTSGILTSYDAFKFTHGYAEIRAKIPKGDGLWPAFWLLNGYYVSQQPEIDILEVRGEEPSEIVHSYHYHENGSLISQSYTTSHPDKIDGYANDFHTYGVRWQPGKIDWYVDGELKHSLEGEEVSYQVMYVIVNLAVGGNFNYSPVDLSLFPTSFDIDYVRVYQEKGLD